MTLQVLWEEYVAEHPDGYRYSRFCDLFRRWEGRLPLTMRQSHGGGEKLFVDYAGDTVPVVDRRTGEVRPAHLFVAVMGGSSLSFACATWTEQLGDWIEAHNAAFAFFGGAPQLLVPDNAKVAVIKACRYDPMVNRSYTDMARHYGTAVLPARPRRPRDKAKVEACVGIVERWLLGRLRNRIFYSLAEVNAAVAACMADLNEARVLRQYGKTRRQLFEEVDAPNLKPLPAEPWAHAEWKRCRVGLDYHIAIERHHYSVPCRFARREVEARITARTVEVFLGSERIAVHMRGSGNGRHTTIPEHMPSSHRRYGDWTPAKTRRSHSQPRKSQSSTASLPIAGTAVQSRARSSSISLNCPALAAISRGRPTHRLVTPSSGAAYGASSISRSARNSRLMGNRKSRRRVTVLSPPCTDLPRTTGSNGIAAPEYQKNCQKQ